MKAFLTLLAGLTTLSATAQQAPQTLLRPHFTDQSIRIETPDTYASALPEIHSNLIAVAAQSGTFYYDRTGKCVFGSNTPLRAVGENYYFKDGVVLVQYNGKTVLLYPDGSYKPMPTGLRTPGGQDNNFTLITPFQDGIALTWRGGFMNRMQVFIDKNFREVVGAPKFEAKSSFGDAELHPLKDGLRRFYNPVTQQYGYLNAKNTMAIPSRYHNAQDFSDGLAAVQVTVGATKRWGFIDKLGKLVIPATYTLMPGRFTEGVAPVRIGTSESDFVMNYIDRTGARLMPANQKRLLNEFHDGFAWVGNGCDGLYVIDRQFKQVRDMTADFYHSGNGFGVCSFKMGFDFPNCMQALNQSGAESGDIFRPDGTLLYAAVNADGGRVNLSAPTADGLMFCHMPFAAGETRLGGEAMTVQCFVNTNGEIVYYFVQGYEGFEGAAALRTK